MYSKVVFSSMPGVYTVPLVEDCMFQMCACNLQCVVLPTQWLVLQVLCSTHSSYSGVPWNSTVITVCVYTYPYKMTSVVMSE